MFFFSFIFQTARYSRLTHETPMIKQIKRAQKEDPLLYYFHLSNGTVTDVTDVSFVVAPQNASEREFRFSDEEKENLTKHEKNLRYAKFLNQLAKAKQLPEDPKIRYSLMYKILKNDPAAQLDLNQLTKMSSSGFGEKPSLQKSNLQLSSSNRQLTCSEGGCAIPLSWEDIYGYGCWCNFNQDISKGYGSPVDAWDQVCKSVQLCTRCIQFDKINSNQETCDLANTSYKNNINFNINTSTLESDCETDNFGDECAIGLCQCELQMYRELYQLTISDVNPADLSFKHENGFDRQDEGSCQKRAHSTFETSQCCGNYPTRYPFNDFLFQCCDNHVTTVGNC